MSFIIRIIQSLYYAPAGRYINDSADRVHSIIRVVSFLRFYDGAVPGKDRRNKWSKHNTADTARWLLSKYSFIQFNQTKQGAVVWDGFGYFI